MDEVQLDELRRRLKYVQNAWKDLRAAGVHQELLEIYLVYKTKLKRKQVRAMIKNMDRFYDKLYKEETARKI